MIQRLGLARDWFWGVCVASGVLGVGLGVDSKVPKLQVRA